MSGLPPYQSPYQQPPGYLQYAPAVQLKNSGVGVASFIIGVAMGLLEGAMCVLATVMVMQKNASNSPPMVVAGCGLILGLLGCVVGVILGIVGLAQPNTRKTFAILGLCFNGLILLAVGSLFLIGILSR